MILGGPVFLTSEVPLLGPYGGPRGEGVFLWARCPCTEGGGKKGVAPPFLVLRCHRVEGGYLPPPAGFKRFC